jgi:Ca2+/Na+ antiporter
MAFYGFILSFGAKLIGDGSELLLEIMDPGIIGGLVLPVLGAVPDSMMVLASGIAGSRCDAETQLQIGMGTLAGSTIMLNTIIWGVSVILGRCDIQHGEARDRVCSYPLFSRDAWLRSGVTVDHDTLWNARIMVTVTLSYFIVQGVAFAYLSDPDGTTAQDTEHWFALAAFIVAVILLICYCAYQLLNPKLQEKKIAAAREKYQKQLTLDRWMFAMRNKSGDSSTSNVLTPLLGSPNTDAPEPAAKPPVDIRAVGLRWKSNAALQAQQKREAAINVAPEQEEGGDDDDDEEDNEEIKGLTKGQIATRAAIQLFIGTAIVTLFSDPMVEVIDNFGVSTGIPAFLLSFILTPICSNASEIISSFMMAMKKRRKNISLTFSQVYGAATMNATLVAGVFYALVTFRQLPWTYSAETLSIILVSWIVGVPGSFIHTYPLWIIIHVMLLYPISLGFVFILEKFAGWT